MANVVKRQNMTISIREYQDNQGNQKKVWKTIGELVTWDDGNQSFETWGPTGSVRGNVFDQDNNQSAPQQNMNQGMQQTPQGYQQQAPQGYYNQDGTPMTPQQMQQNQG